MDRVTLQNYRCFGSEKQSARLAPLTLLVGPNSAGKTSFLALIRALWDVAFREVVPYFRDAPYDLGSFQDVVHQVRMQSIRMEADAPSPIHLPLESDSVRFRTGWTKRHSKRRSMTSTVFLSPQPAHCLKSNWVCRSDVRTIIRRRSNSPIKEGLGNEPSTVLHFKTRYDQSPCGSRFVTSDHKERTKINSGMAAMIHPTKESLMRTHFGKSPASGFGDFRFCRINGSVAI